MFKIVSSKWGRLFGNNQWQQRLLKDIIKGSLDFWIEGHKITILSWMLRLWTVHFALLPLGLAFLHSCTMGIFCWLGALQLNNSAMNPLVLWSSHQSARLLMFTKQPWCWKGYLQRHLSSATGSDQQLASRWHLCMKRTSTNHHPENSNTTCMGGNVEFLGQIFQLTNYEANFLALRRGLSKTAIQNGNILNNNSKKTPIWTTSNWSF